MSNAGSDQEMAPPPSLFSHLGPLIPAHATAARYAAAVGVVFIVFALRASLSPLLGVQAPLLPFLLGVLLAAYLGGRGPALLATGLLPVLATLWLTGWPHDAPPWQWVLHVLFFMIIGGLSAFIVEALQNAVRRADENARLARVAAEALRDTDRRKDEFLAMLAHELRNPLTPVRNIAHILGRAPDAATVKRASEMLERQATHLTRLVDDLLDVARITHRRVELKHERVSLEEVAATAIETVQPAIEARKQEVITTITTPQVYVDGDLVRLCQVVSNLLSNASKYSPEGKRIQLNIGGDASTATLTVRDEGMGIDAQLMPRLFELFMQGDRSLDRSQDGLGIGLTIVKNLVEMHGGSVQASSAGVGKGSEFLIELPRAAAPAVSRLRMSSLTNHSVRRRRVLIVEDNADCAESLRAVLATDGHEVRVVDEGAKALETLEGFAAEVVLLDVGLPRMDGFMVAHAIRARYEKQAMRPRIIALTGYAKLEDRQAALRSGFDDHVSKPLDPRRLSSLVSEESRPAREEATQRG
jgi:signal transduction histidine kinase/ActR/RegA family two-component response regulator